ncbi:acyl-CoA dehydrogenase family protein [Coleofasciculus sp. H7-2]|uniref:acyl-CoA dehydrogenase family protein n=1 Tax=Coleofasciculus sp. H7-2 TaxID=3351545 RepID=UPI003670D591
MTTLLNRIELKDYAAIATALSQELAASAVERDSQAGVPHEEVRLLRQSGLLPLVVPREYGGIGATWVEALKILQEIAKADGSTGQLYSNQLVLSVVAQASGTPAQTERYYRATAQNHLFWGNAFNTRDTRLKIEPEGELTLSALRYRFRVNGIKTFGTGVAAADMRVFAAVQEGVDYPIVFILPKDREGIVYNNDWDNMAGLTQSLYI